MKRSASLSRLVAVAALALAGTGAALAQSYPTKPVRVVVPYSPGGGAEAERSTIPGGTRPYDVQGANPKPELPAIKLERRDNSGSSFAPGGPTLRIGLTLYAVDTGKVIRAATSSCITINGQAEQAGITMIDNIFDDADKNRLADAGCPL